MLTKDLKNKKYMCMFHGKATDTLALAILYTGSSSTNVFTKETTIKVNDVEFKFSPRNNIRSDTEGIHYVSTHKLLSVATILLCAQNNADAVSSGRRNYKVVIPLRLFAILCGHNIREDGAKSGAEKKRERNILKDLRKKVDRDLNVLFTLELNWAEKKKVKKKDKEKAEIVNYIDMHMISAKGITNGNIIIDFTPDFAEYLIKLPITQYPLALLKIDERNKNSYSMGLQMAEHANMPSNIKMKTANLLKVSSLLKYTNLPCKDNSSVKKAGWRERIKSPFENSLDALTRCGLLKKWEYTHSKGIPLTKEETDFITFEKWNETLVHFVLTDQPDHTNQQEKESDNKRLEEKSEGDVTVDNGGVTVGNRGVLL